MKQTSIDVLQFIDSKEGKYVSVEDIMREFPALTMRNINGIISSLTKLHKVDGVVIPLLDMTKVPGITKPEITAVKLNADGKNFVETL